MAVSSKPRKRYRSRGMVTNPISLAVRRASRMTPGQIATIFIPIQESFTAMREGVGTESQWMILMGSLALATAIEKQGVVRGVLGHLNAAEAALAGIKHRAMAQGSWKPTAMYWQEIDALDTLLVIHQFQMETLSEGEWRRAYEHAVAVIRGAGGEVVDTRELEGEQLQLLGGKHG